MGDIPVAQIVKNGSSVTVHYTHTDQLNAPRKITLPSTNALAWRWDPHPFGEQTPKQNPSGLGMLVNSLRFPGQYYCDTSSPVSLVRSRAGSTWPNVQERAQDISAKLDTGQWSDLGLGG